MPGNKSRVSPKCFENQQVREKNFQGSDSSFCPCSAFLFSAVGHVKKNAFLAQKNPTVISDSSRIFPGLTAAELIYHSFLMGTRR